MAKGAAATGWLHNQAGKWCYNVVCKERSALREKARPTHSLLTYYSEVSKWLEAIAKRARHDATAQRTSVRKHFKGRGVAGK